MERTIHMIFSCTIYMHRLQGRSCDHFNNYKWSQRIDLPTGGVHVRVILKNLADRHLGSPAEFLRITLLEKTTTGRCEV